MDGCSSFFDGIVSDLCRVDFIVMHKPGDSRLVFCIGDPYWQTDERVEEISNCYHAYLESQDFVVLNGRGKGGIEIFR